MKLSNPVKNEIRAFIYANINGWKMTANDSGLEWCDQYLELTIACDDSGQTWNFQTGDNSYMGACYGLSNWAIATIDFETEARGLSADIIDQLEEALALQASIDLYHSQGRG
jgi:hypothetical protein